MKVGDKVYIETEVIKVNDVLVITKLGCFDKLEVIPQLPIQEGRWMMVSEDKNQWLKRKVFMQKNGKYIAWSFATDEDSVLLVTHTASWKYAKEIPTKRKLTMQEIAEKFGEDVENIEIEK